VNEYKKPTFSTSQLSKMPPTLLGLPRELRNAIYENLTSNTHANIKKHPLNLETLPSGTRRHTHGAHSLMRTNRTLRIEVRGSTFGNSKPTASAKDTVPLQD